MAEQMYLVEARRAARNGGRAELARFVLIAGSRYAALSKLRVYYDTNDLDSVTAEPISGVLPIAGALVHEMLRRPSAAESQPLRDPDPDEPWQQ